MNDSFFHPNPYVLRLGRDRKNPSEEDTSVIQAACYKWTAEIGATGLEGEAGEKLRLRAFGQVTAG